MEKFQKTLLIVAGEASGDIHAAHLVDELKKLDPSLKFCGLGGPQMQKSGVDLYEDMTKFAVVGFLEVLKHYDDFKRIFNLILEKAVTTRVHAVILVDYPGFNLRLARELKKFKIKVIYYISPQLWAWKENRIKLIKQTVDKMLVLFPFEKDFYAQRGMDVEYVGHPLVDDVKVMSSADTFLKSVKFDTTRLTFGILPGSRQKEVEVHLPIMIEAARLLSQRFQQVQFLVFRAPTVNALFIKKCLRTLEGTPIKMVSNETYNGINACNLCLVASGTATLETAILQKPIVVVYKTSLLTYWLAKLFVKIPYIGLVNVVAGKKIVPECIQGQATPQKLADEIEAMLKDEPRLADIKMELKKVKEALGEGGASKRAAQAVLNAI